ncbi:hypothetical protein [Streptomyces sp. NPDC057966]|uniref:hypothetical protein n=1 Tax=Streptomyces sp. NPDC057966 TaxID=3346292 RepID=UPI0036EF90FD
MVTTPPFRASFDPKCTVWTSFASLRTGDRVDYWGAARPITEVQVFDDGRVRVLVDNGVGQDFALVPGTEEHTWREPREDEYLEASRKVLQAVMKEAFPTDGPGCCQHVTCKGDGPCGYIVLASAVGSIRCDCTGQGPHTGSGEGSAMTMSTSCGPDKDAIPSDLDRWAPHEITQWLADLEADEDVSEEHLRQARQAVRTALGLDD